MGRIIFYLYNLLITPIYFKEQRICKNADAYFVCDSLFKKKEYLNAAVKFEKLATKSFSLTKKRAFYKAAIAYNYAGERNKACLNFKKAAKLGLAYFSVDDMKKDTLFQVCNCAYDKTMLLLLQKRINIQQNNVDKFKWFTSKVDSIHNEDQKIRRYLTKNIEVLTREQNDSIFNYQLRIDSINQKMLANIITKYNWLGYDEIGYMGDNLLWLIAQHADNNISLQKRALNSIKYALIKGNTARSHYAYLLDRIYKNENKAQLFGTQYQGDNINRTVIFRPIKDIQQVDKLRLFFDLSTLQEYKKFASDHYYKR